MFHHVSRVLVILMLISLAGVTFAAEDRELTELELQYLADMATHYKFEAEKLQGILETGLALEEMPVTLHVHRLDGTNPVTLAEVRTRGDSWMPILKNRGALRSDAFYIVIKSDIGSEVYAPTFAKFSAVPRDHWKSIDLADDEIVNMVNLGFLYSHHDYSVFEIMAMRDKGMSFPEINSEVGQRKEAMIQEQKRKLKQAQAKETESGS